MDEAVRVPGGELWQERAALRLAATVARLQSLLQRRKVLDICLGVFCFFACVESALGVNPPGFVHTAS